MIAWTLGALGALPIGALFATLAVPSTNIGDRRTRLLLAGIVTLLSFIGALAGWLIGDAINPQYC